jgi:hypothetical protein
MTERIALYLHPTIDDLEQGKMEFTLLTPLPADGIVQVDLTDFLELLSKFEKLEKEFREYVNRPGPSSDYVAGGGWRR